MTKINPISIRIEGIDYKLGNIEPFVQAFKKVTVAQRNQLKRYISDFISEEMGLAKKVGPGALARYTTPAAAPDGEIEIEEFARVTGIRISQSEVLKDSRIGTFEAKVGGLSTTGDSVEFTSKDVGRDAAGFKTIDQLIGINSKRGGTDITGPKAYRFLKKSPTLQDEFNLLIANMSEKIENLMLIKIVDGEKGGKRAELDFIQNPLKGININNPKTYSEGGFIDLRIRPRQGAEAQREGKKLTAYRIIAKPTKRLRDSWKSTRITKKFMEAHGKAFSTGLQEYVFKRLDQAQQRITKASKKKSPDQIRQIASYTVALAREFEAGGQTPLAIATGLRVPNLNIKEGSFRVNAKGPKQKPQKFISGVQLTQLVQRRLQKTMRKFGEPEAPDLTERSGRFRTSVEIIANYRKNLIAYRFNPLYKSLDKYGYKPSDQVGKATREVVQTLFGRAFNIIEG